MKLDISNLVESTKIDFNKFVKILVYLLKNDSQEPIEKLNFDYIDAFVALGGENDGSGYVEMEILKKALQEFDLNINLKDIFDKLGMNG